MNKYLEEWSDLLHKLEMLKLECRKPDGPDWQRIHTIAKDLELLSESVVKQRTFKDKADNIPCQDAAE
jgi:hypothetical protein